MSRTVCEPRSYILVSDASVKHLPPEKRLRQLIIRTDEWQSTEQREAQVRCCREAALPLVRPKHAVEQEGPR